MNWFSKLFKKKERVVIETTQLIIPSYVIKIQNKYNKDLTDEYKGLIRDGITGRSIIKKTLTLHCKTTK